MHTTSVTLLDRLRQPRDEDAWKRFVDLYTPLLYHWARRLGLREADAVELVQDVFALLVEKLPQFAYDRNGSFRAWLRTVLLNRWRERQRRHTLLVGAVPDDVPGPDPVLEIAEAEYRQWLVGRALQLMQAQFQPTTWKACWEYVVSGRPAAEVARELGISTGAVRVATSRVLHRLRQELTGLLE